MNNNIVVKIVVRFFLAGLKLAESLLTTKIGKEMTMIALSAYILLHFIVSEYRIPHVGYDNIPDIICFVFVWLIITIMLYSLRDFINDRIKRGD